MSYCIKRKDKERYLPTVRWLPDPYTITQQDEELAEKYELPYETVAAIKHSVEEKFFDDTPAYRKAIYIRELEYAAYDRLRRIQAIKIKGS